VLDAYHHYLGQASITSRDILVEKISANTEFKLSFTSPSIEELASSFRTDGHQSSDGFEIAWAYSQCAFTLVSMTFC
jgi:hypothetical protein